MLTDYKLRFMEARAITAADRYVGGGPDADTDEGVDLGAAGDALAGSELEIEVVIKTSLASGTSVAFTFETHTSNDFSAARTVLWSSGTILTAAALAGVRYKFKWPQGCKRYVALVATAAGTHDAGTVDAYVAQVIQKNDL